MDEYPTERRVSIEPSRRSLSPSISSIGGIRPQSPVNEFVQDLSPRRMRSRPTASDFFEAERTAPLSGDFRNDESRRRSTQDLSCSLDNTKCDNDRGDDDVSLPPKAVIRLTREQALRTPFPEGCPVFVCSEDRCSNRMGEVASASVSFEHGAGQVVVFYNVIFRSGNEASEGERMTVRGVMLKFAPGCPVHMKHAGSQREQEWTDGTVIGSCEIPSTAEESVVSPQVLYSVQLSAGLQGGRNQQPSFEHGVSTIRLRFRSPVVKPQETNENGEMHVEDCGTDGSQAHELRGVMDHGVTASTEDPLDAYDSEIEEYDTDTKAQMSNELAPTAADTADKSVASIDTNAKITAVIDNYRAHEKIPTKASQDKQEQTSFHRVCQRENLDVDNASASGSSLHGGGKESATLSVRSDHKHHKNASSTPVKEQPITLTSAQPLQQVKEEPEHDRGNLTSVNNQCSSNEPDITPADASAVLAKRPASEQHDTEHSYERSIESRRLSGRWAPPAPVDGSHSVPQHSAMDTNKRFADLSACDDRTRKKSKTGYRGTLFIPRPRYNQKDVVDTVIGPPLRQNHQYLVETTGCLDITVNCCNKECIAVLFTHKSEEGAQEAANRLSYHITGKINNVANRSQLKRDMWFGEITPLSASESVSVENGGNEASHGSNEYSVNERIVIVKAGYRGHVLIPRKYGQVNIKAAVIGGPERRAHSLLMQTTKCTQIVLMSNRRDYDIVRFIHSDREGARDAGLHISDHIIRTMSHSAYETDLRRDIIIDSVAPASSSNRWTDKTSPLYVPQPGEQGNYITAPDTSDHQVTGINVFRGKIFVPKVVGQKDMQESFIGTGRAVHNKLLEVTGCRHLKFLPNAPEVDNHFVVDFSHDSREGAATAGAIFCNHVVKSVTNGWLRRQLRTDLRCRIFSYTWEGADFRGQKAEPTATCLLYIPDWIHEDTWKRICHNPDVAGRVKVNSTAEGLFFEGNSSTLVGKGDEEVAKRKLEDLLLDSVKGFQRGRALYEMACSQSSIKAHCQIVHQRSPDRLEANVWMCVLLLPCDTDRRHSYLASLKDLTRLQLETSSKIEIHGEDIWGKIESDAGGRQPYILVTANEREQAESGGSTIKRRLHEVKHMKNRLSVAKSDEDKTLL